jgi:cytochrome c biogenesis protein CcdA/thiol-disulfide isomerase/thioredoxin
MIKKLKILTFVLGLFFAGSVFAQVQPVEMDFFYLPTCPHCHSEREFLEQLKQKYSELEIREYSIEKKENLDLLIKKYKDYEVPQDAWGRVPATFFDSVYIIGFKEGITDNQLDSYVSQIIEKRKEAEINNPDGRDDIGEITTPVDDKTTIKLPFIGEVNVSNYSPLVLSVLFGALDGFNPCAMTALCFLLASLVASGARKRILLIGGVFIFVSGLVYFLFIAAWFNLFLALAYVKFITTLVGILVLFFAFTVLKEYFSGVICKLCETEAKKDFASENQKKLLLKMEKITRAEVPLMWSLLGVGLIAAGVNMVELFCSMGFPAAFTGILSDMGISKMSFYLYLLVYILFYMLDDLIIFLIAVATLRITQASQKYLKFVKLISGILLLILGLILVFRPSLLTFS